MVDTETRNKSEDEGRGGLEVPCEGGVGEAYWVATDM
jgi:hypothetical protein